ncbi:cold shock domain-containing protein [Roseomonas gilardii]|uniref:Cold shock domain-containing protein n=1 Tax=Roseomonas gilardii TaxID=257708 RepID=A0ABU3MBJ3_9PROT|nr:cold shock domain-containing protein [Roseomonas gilardii]MDT8329861.1 cold shock domain-containing protein [Roseomonas gilardii]
MERLTGRVIWYQPAKGYGFIQADDGGPDVMVHATALRAAALDGLEKGQRLSFAVEDRDGRRGAVAIGLMLDGAER